MDSVSSLHVIMRNVLFVSQGFSSINETNHRHIDSFLLLQSLLNLQDGVCGLEVE